MQHPLSTTPDAGVGAPPLRPSQHSGLAQLEQASACHVGPVVSHTAHGEAAALLLPAASRELRVFSLMGHDPLVERVCQRLGVTPALHEARVFDDGEHKTRPLDSVRGQDVYVVGSLYGDEEASVNDKLVRMLYFVATVRDAGARRVSVVAPYLCHARKDMRTKPRDPVSSRYLAQLFEAVGTDRVLCLDVHNPAAYENAFRIPAELLTAAPLLAGACQALLGEREVVVVSPDPGGVKRAERFRGALERRLQRPVGFGFVEKTRSEGTVRGGAVVGAVEAKAVVLVDDLINRGTTLALAAAACRARGAQSVYAVATHGLFSPDAGAVLANSGLARVLVLDTVPLPAAGRALLEQYVQVVDAAPLLAGAIARLHTEGSLTELLD